MKRWIQFLCPAMVIALAIAVGLVLHVSQLPSDIDIRLDGDSPFSPSELTDKQIDTYHREGVVFVPNLLPETQAVHVRESGEYAMSRMFSMFALFASDRYKNIAFDLWRTSPEIASLSLQALPKIASQILQDSKDESGQVRFRLLRDAMFQYQPGGIGCGWHVDDRGFWPAEHDTAGPTIWIALDELKISEGGGLTVFSRTKFQELEPANVTEAHCRQVISKNTCGMTQVSPECEAKLDASKLEWDMKPGDAIIWDRWTFHRSVPAISLDESNLKRRYSVRYVPHGAKTFGGVNPSVQQGGPFNSPFYPQVWPSLVDSETKALEHGLEPDFKIQNIPGVIYRLIKFKIKAKLSSGD